MATSTSLSTIRNSIEQNTTEFISCYETAAKTNDPNSISVHLSSDCRRFLASRAFRESNGIPPGTSLSNADYQAAYQRQMPIWQVTSTEIFNLTIDVEGRKAAARTVDQGEFVDGEKLVLEFAWFLDFNDAGTEITKIMQYADPTESLLFRTKAKELQEKLKEEAEKASESRGRVLS